MKKIYSILLVMFIGIMVFVGCSKDKDEAVIDQSAVLSNGGMSVQQGEYLYFVNGFVSYETLTDAKTQNKFGDVVTGAIYRTKLVNGEVSSNSEGFLNNAERIVSKVVGFEKGGFYLYDDYIYYTTPNMQNDGEGKLLNDTVDLCRIKIDGSNSKVVKAAVKLGDTGEWRAYKIGEEVLFVYYASEQIVSVKATGKSAGETVIMAKDVTGASLPTSTIYSKSNIEKDARYADKFELVSYNQTIYFTKDLAEDDKSYVKGNILARVKIGSSEIKEVTKTDYKYTILEQKDGYLFYKKQNGKISSDNGVIYRSSILNDKFASETKLTDSAYSSSYILESAGSTSAVVVYDNSTLRLINDGGASSRNLVSGTLTVVGTAENSIFYIRDSKLYSVNIEGTVKELALSGKTPYTDKVLKFDIVNNRIFMFVKYTSETTSDVNYYLNMLDISINSEMVFVGSMPTAHMPVEAEEPNKRV